MNKKGLNSQGKFFLCIDVVVRIIKKTGFKQYVFNKTVNQGQLR